MTPNYVDTNAVFSSCGRYRYSLYRRWDEGDRLCMFIGLNPSTADASQDDPTIRRIVGFARGWGYHALLMGNLFAYRSTDPKQLYNLMPGERIGPLNVDHLSAMANRADVVVLGWGNHGKIGRQSEHLLHALPSGINLFCLGRTKIDQPKHPLYLSKTTELELYTTTSIDNEQ